MRSLCALGLLMILRTAGAATPLVVYDDALRNGFNDRSWTTTYSLANTSPVHAGTKSISFTASNFEGLQFVADNVEFNLADYQSATFWVNGGSAGSQSLTLYVSDNYAAVGDTYDVATLIGGGAIPKNSWKQVTLDFDAAGLTFGTFNGIVIQDRTGGAGQPVLYVDDIEFMPRTSPPPSGGTVECHRRHRVERASVQSADFRRRVRRRHAQCADGLYGRPLGRQFDDTLQLASRHRQQGVRLLVPQRTRRQRCGPAETIRRPTNS